MLGVVVCGAIFVGVFTWMIYDQTHLLNSRKSKSIYTLDIYGHVASLLKAFVVFAAVSEIMVTFAGFALLSAPVIVMALVFATYDMAQATKL